MPFRPVENAVLRNRHPKKKRQHSNYAALNRLLPLSQSARSEREKAQNLLLALFANESEESRREMEGMRSLAAALGLELKPRALRLKW